MTAPALAAALVAALGGQATIASPESGFGRPSPAIILLRYRCPGGPNLTLEVEDGGGAVLILGERRVAWLVGRGTTSLDYTGDAFSVRGDRAAIRFTRTGAAPVTCRAR